jgi:hypothetical protein
MKRGLLVAAAVLLAASLSLGGLRLSGAVFTDASASTITATSASVTSLLHLYSQSSDPNHLTGYYMQPGGSTLAATGTDLTLAVNLGKQPNSTTNQTQVFTVVAASPLPTGITAITVTASLTNDPTTGLQPLTGVGFSAVNGSSRTSPVSLTAGQKMQCNVRTNVARPSGTVYKPNVVLTVTYTGFTGTFYQYTVPFTVTAQ